MKRIFFNNFESLSRLSIGIGGFVDLVGGLALLFAPTTVANIVGVPVPEDLYYVRLFGITAFVLGALFIIAARNPTRHQSIIYLSAVMRALAIALLIVSLSAGTAPDGFMKFALIEGPITLVHIAYALSLCKREACLGSKASLLAR